MAAARELGRVVAVELDEVVDVHLDRVGGGELLPLARVVAAPVLGAPAADEEVEVVLAHDRDASRESGRFPSAIAPGTRALPGPPTSRA
jgi:hypothetical protein